LVFSFLPNILISSALMNIRIEIGGKLQNSGFLKRSWAVGYDFS